MNYFEETEIRLQKRLKEFNMNSNDLPLWVYEDLKHPEQLDNFRFYRLLPPTDYSQQLINPDNIIGKHMLPIIEVTSWIC